MTMKKKMGRPVGYTDYPNSDDIKNKIVSWVSEGKTLRDFCRQEEMPAFGTIYKWLESDKEFESLFASAREVGQDSIAEECMAIADKEPLEVFDEAGNKRYDPGSISWRKMQIETRLKLLSKWNPKYSDKTILAGDDKAPVVIEASFDIFGELLKNIALKRQAGE